MAAKVSPEAAANKIRKNLENNRLHVFQGGDHELGMIVCPREDMAGCIRADRPTHLYQGPPGSGPLLRLRGIKMPIEGQLYLHGNGVDPIIEVEGSSKINTGYHRFTGLSLLNCPPAGAWKALDGYYEFNEKIGTTGKFVTDPNHADNCLIDNCHTYGAAYSFVTLNNLQALRWTARDCSINGISQKDEGDIIGADIIDGGLFTFNNLIANCPRFKKFRPHGLRPNCNYLVSTNFTRDCPTTDNEYFTILDDSLIDPRPWVDEWEGGKWILDVSCFIPRHAKPYDESKHFTKRALYNKKLSNIRIVLGGDPPQENK